MNFASFTLKDKKVPAELHVYPEGGHGFGLAIGKGYLQTWTDRLADWLGKLNQNDPAKEEWQPMFNGKDLSGWKIRGGEATYAVDGDMVVGSSKGRYNTFLSTEKDYGDFILELELLVDPSMNSGIQIRSHESKYVFGYQIEVDPAERAWSGGIYDESRRGWLYPLTYNQKGRKAFKNGIWKYLYK